MRSTGGYVRGGWRAIERWLWVVLVLAIAAPAAARAETPGDAPVATGPGERPPRLIAKPQWLYTPTYNEMMRLYPERALRLRWEGDGQVRCVHRQQRLEQCEVLSQDPEGRGFGAGLHDIGAGHGDRPGAPEGDFGFIID